jgi:hypothetical protein
MFLQREPNLTLHNTVDAKQRIAATNKSEVINIGKEQQKHTVPFRGPQ